MHFHELVPSLPVNFRYNLCAKRGYSGSQGRDVNQATGGLTFNGSLNIYCIAIIKGEYPYVTGLSATGVIENRLV